MEKSFKTAAPYRIGIMVRSQRYRKSLAGLLVTMPGVDILFEDTPSKNIFEMMSLGLPDMLLVAGSLSGSDSVCLTGADFIRRVRTVWPKLKIVFLVEPSHFVPGAHLGGADLILPIDTTAGELLQSINRLAGREASPPIYNPLVTHL